MEITAQGLGSLVGEILACVERGETLTVTCRGRPGARLVGIEQPRDAVRGEKEASPAFGMWKDRPDLADVQAHVGRLRDGRLLAG